MPLFSPAQPPVRRDAPLPELRSRLIEILNVPIEILGGRKCWRGFPFAKTHCTGERPHEVRSVPPPVSTCLQPCLGQGASRRAGVGWVRSQAILSILKSQ
jgi:hypothetical protein